MNNMFSSFMRFYTILKLSEMLISLDLLKRSHTELEMVLKNGMGS